MNNLHRELAPISDAAWRDLEGQVRDAFALASTARRVVDVPESRGPTLAAVDTGRLGDAEELTGGVQRRIRLAQPAVELRRTFEASRDAVDSVERGAQDPDWSAAVTAAQQLAAAEDHAVFSGVAAANATGLRSGSSHADLALPADVADVPTAVARAREVLRSAAVGGPYALLLDPERYAELSGAVLDGCPGVEQLARIAGGEVLPAPALDGAQLVSTRGGDYELVLGRDLSIGYLGHDATTITLYLEESFVFRAFTPEAAVALR